MNREPEILSRTEHREQASTGTTSDAPAPASLRSIIRVLATQAARDAFRRAVGAGDSTVTEASPRTSTELSGND